MGWSGPQRGTVADAIREILNPSGDGSIRSTCIAHTETESVLRNGSGTVYAVYENTEGGCVHSRELVVCLVQGPMLKQMPETHGPPYPGCPLEFLDMVPEPSVGFAAGWRDRVRLYRGHRAVVAGKDSIMIGQRVGWCLGGKLGRAAIGVIVSETANRLTVVIESVERGRDASEVGATWTVPRAMICVEVGELAEENER